MADRKDVPHVVIVGGGFGGLNAAMSLAGAPVRVTLVDRTNHHLFQPLLYQVATAGLSPADIAVPIRSVFSRQRNVRVLLAEAKGVDLPGKRLLLDKGELRYDYLVLAVGATHNFFGHDEWATHALGLKTLDEALRIRERMLLAFESAERTTDPEARRRLLTFVVIGGGPTGVEMAGAFSELATHVLSKDFRAIDPSQARVVLVEAGPRILAAFPEDLAHRAEAQLASLGVAVEKGRPVARIDDDGIAFGDGERIDAATVVWAAGVRGTKLSKALGVELDRGGRVKVSSDCSLPGHPEVFAIGDMAACRDKNGVEVPGLCPAAIQQGQYVARVVRDEIRGKPRQPFVYLDKGAMATVGRKRAIAMMGKLELAGFVAWLAWMAVHVFFLIGFKNRFLVMFNWIWQYFTWKRGARLITTHTGVEPGLLLAAAPDGPVPSLRPSVEAESAERAP
ncbi:NAD(P)/FAD-dependent oxidoreductase [Polyangium spumosum]|uniref:NADH:ubiquinone reductase (non-electrogenic) n=1 Tax=Polyangium spumosum TaxID=889282 RepID=A0A6N7PRV4_9BACT|nr:NAD(P)/FAD-dependent oxidoreductase [Polyangium spumosum]MRG94669.1 FAD-binding protein [Polyangium spumosum]